MPQTPLAAPAASLGWDQQFTRIAQHVARRIRPTLTELASECAEQGLRVRIQHRLYDDRACSNLLVIAQDCSIVLVLSFILNDGWVLRGVPGALLETELRLGEDLRRAYPWLPREEDQLCAQPEDVWRAAGDMVNRDALTRQVRKYICAA